MAAVDYFLKIDTIPGESTKKGHTGELEITSWSWGESNTGSMAGNTGGGSGKVSMQDFHFTIPMNVASPKIMLACATGQHIPTAILICRKAGTEQQEYLKITFSDVLISSYHVGGSHADVIPGDQCSFNFTKIEMGYKPQDAKGQLGAEVKTGYDLKQMQKV